MGFTLESSSLEDGRPIPERYAVAVPTPEGRAEMAGRDLSPHLRWSGEPEGTRSFAITVVDPDVPADRNRMGVEGLSLGDDESRVRFAHWLIADIPADVHEIAEGADGDGFVAHGKPPGPTAVGGISGANGYGGLFEGNADLEGTYGGWDGPFPPWNDEQCTTTSPRCTRSTSRPSASTPGSRSRRSRRRSTGTCSLAPRSCRPTR